MQPFKYFLLSISIFCGNLDTHFIAHNKFNETAVPYYYRLCALFFSLFSPEKFSLASNGSENGNTYSCWGRTNQCVSPVDQRKTGWHLRQPDIHRWQYTSRRYIAEAGREYQDSRRVPVQYHTGAGDLHIPER